MSEECKLPPAGWACTRGVGHTGPCAAVETIMTTGWASPTLARCYQDVEKLRANLAQPTESGIDESLRDLLSAIERADCELEAVT